MYYDSIALHQDGSVHDSPWPKCFGQKSLGRWA